MSDSIQIRLTVNSEDITCLVPVRRNLVDFLRSDLGLTGTHVGCEHGVCGACSVRLNGRVIRGCLILAVQADGTNIETIEGVSERPEFVTLRERFLKRNALQCGFCTPGMLLTADELLREEAAPSREVIREYISGNFCRCTGYQSIVDAIESAAEGRGRPS